MDRCHLARAKVAACYNELCGAAAQTVERPRVYAIIPRIVEAFAAASEDAWLQRDVSWVIERFRAAGWEPGPKPSFGAPAADAAKPSIARVTQLAFELLAWLHTVASGSSAPLSAPPPPPPRALAR